MARSPMPDVVVLLPGITGSVLQRNGKVTWGFSGATLAGSLFTRGRSLNRALALREDPPEEDDLGDGVEATELIPDLHLLPGFWKIDGYTRVAQTLQARFQLTEGENFFTFPYDWRRDNRVAARKLARDSHGWLKRWRESGNPDAKLVLIAHSMGGLVARYFLEVLEGWKDTRALVSFGTPYRGSLNALDTLANGMRKGPMGLLDLSELARTFTSIYQLLPIYKCYDRGNGDLVRVGETEGIPNVDPKRAASALAFHREIEEAVNTHRTRDDYLRDGYRTFPVVGIGQPTHQSARSGEGGVQLFSHLEGTDRRGDGTVPRVSAVPIEESRGGRGMFAATRHGSLQNADAVLTHVDGVVQSLYFDLGEFREPAPAPVEVALEVEDLCWSDEPVGVRARPSREDVELSAALVNGNTGEVVASQEMNDDDDGWRVTAFSPPGAGAYRIRVTGGPEVAPAEDAVAVASMGSGQAEEVA